MILYKHTDTGLLVLTLQRYSRGDTHRLYLTGKKIGTGTVEYYLRKTSTHVSYEAREAFLEEIVHAAINDGFEE